MSTGINRETGKTLSDWDHVVQSIIVIFTTRIGDRVLRRSFGSAVPRVLGKNLVPSTLLKFYTAVAIAVSMWEPRFRIRKFEYLESQTSANDLRQGKLGIRMVGDYMPRALEGDFTVESVQTVTF